MPTRWVLVFLPVAIVCSCACPTANLSKQAAKRGDSVAVMRVTPQLEPDVNRASPDNRLFQIAGESMKPGYESGKIMLISESREQLNNLRRGAVVVFRRPEAERTFFVKRIIGLPGETVEVHNGNVYVYNKRFPNGAVLDETAYIYDCEYTSGDHRWQLAPGEYVVLGDNRNESKDSRNWGPLRKPHIEGRVLKKVDTPSVSVHSYHPFRSCMLPGPVVTVN